MQWWEMCQHDLSDLTSEELAEITVEERTALERGLAAKHVVWMPGDECGRLIAAGKADEARALALAHGGGAYITRGWMMEAPQASDKIRVWQYVTKEEVLRRLSSVGRAHPW